VVLHSTDPVTVFLSIQARADVQPTDIERELYEDRTLVRMLGMRRTLFVVPRELVPVVYAACTRSIAARERRRVEQMIADSGISSRPSAWLTRALSSARKALEERGEASTRELVAQIPILAKRLRVASGTKFEATQSVGSRVLPQLAMEGRIVRVRPRGTWINGEYRWAPIETWLGGPITAVEQGAAQAQAQLLRRWLAAFGPATETDIRWWTGWTAREARAALAAVPHAVVDLGGEVGFVLAAARVAAWLGDVRSSPGFLPPFQRELAA